MYSINSSQIFKFSSIENYYKIITLWLFMTVTLTAGSSTLVSEWNAKAIEVTTRVPNPNRNAIIDMAYLHVAIYDAVNSIDGKYSVFAVNPPSAVPYASEEAAASAAARRVLLTFYSADSAYIEAFYTQKIAELPDNSARAKGIEIGNETAVLFLASRNGDGREANVPYIWQDAGTGVYQPTPPGSAQYVPVATWAGQLRTFSVSSAQHFRPPAPPAATSDRYTADFNEVKKYGSLDETFTTPEQREIARFHTENPNIQFNRNVRNFADSRKLSLEDNARFFAQMFVVIGDATITGFGAKYFYNFWRPVTAIRSAESDGNALTIQDDTWQPLAGTPRHPEYPAGHTWTLGAFSRTIELFFGKSAIPVTLSSNVTGTEHHFTDVNDVVTEAVNARVYGGMHFRNSGERGVELGRKVAEWVAANEFQRVNKIAKGNTSSEDDNLNQVEKVNLSFELKQNNPNPFNPTTQISYSIAQAGNVTLTVYDLLGRVVTELINEYKNPGQYSVTFNAAGLSNGIYFYALSGTNQYSVKKMSFLK